MASPWSARPRRRGGPLIVHENFRWQLPYQRLHAGIEAGEIGTPRFLRLSFRHDHDVYANQPYLAEIEDFAIMDVGLHLFDVARFLMGEVRTISCVTQRQNPRVRGEDAFTALLSHESGGVSSIECSFDSHFKEERFPRRSPRSRATGAASSSCRATACAGTWPRADRGGGRAAGARLGRAALASGAGFRRRLRGACGRGSGRADPSAALGRGQPQDPRAGARGLPLRRAGGNGGHGGFRRRRGHAVRPGNRGRSAPGRNR
jgi:hypothetical protein